jgi:hypothetical protein
MNDVVAHVGTYTCVHVVLCFQITIDKASTQFTTMTDDR